MKWLNGYRIRFMLVGFAAAIVIGSGSANADFIFGIPMNLGPPVSTGAFEARPSISADGLSLYFNSNRPGTYGIHDIWFTTRATKDDPWEEPVNLGPTVNSSAWEVAPDISADGLELFFSSDRPGGSGSRDIWVTTRDTKDDEWGTPMNLGTTVNSSSGDRGPHISTDGLELYFNSNRPGGYGDHDIWFTSRTTKDDPWGEALNLGPTVNRSANDFSPSISANSLILFFSSSRPGGYGNFDIWMTTRKTADEDWDTPINLGPPVNSSALEATPSISADGSTLFFWSGRDPGFGGADIWQAPIIPIVDFNGDEIVDIDDLVILIEYWGQNEPLCDIGPLPWGDGIVDVADLEVLMSYWGQEAYDPTLIAHWKLDETEGDIAYDSAAANDGTVHGYPVWQPTAGQIDGALAFDGTDDYVSTDFVLNPADGPFSAFAWIKEGAPGQVIISQADRTIFGTTISPGSAWLSTDPAEGKLMTELQGLDQAGCPLASQTVVTDGGWHRVGLTWDSSNRILYVDDVEVARDTQPQFGSSRQGLYIGAGKNLDADSFFSGLIDDVRIYNRAITP